MFRFPEHLTVGGEEHDDEVMKSKIDDTLTIKARNHKSVIAAGCERILLANNRTRSRGNSVASSPAHSFGVLSPTNSSTGKSFSFLLSPANASSSYEIERKQSIVMETDSRSQKENKGDETNNEDPAPPLPSSSSLPSHHDTTKSVRSSDIQVESTRPRLDASENSKDFADRLTLWLNAKLAQNSSIEATTVHKEVKAGMERLSTISDDSLVVQCRDDNEEVSSANSPDDDGERHQPSPEHAKELEVVNDSIAVEYDVDEIQMLLEVDANNEADDESLLPDVTEGPPTCPMSPNSIDIRQTARMLLILPPSQLRVESEVESTSITEEYEIVDELDGNGNDCGSVSTSKSMASRTTSVLSYRGQNEKHEDNFVFESSNSFKTPRSDVDCLRQANKDLVETVKSLMSKNEALQARNVEISEQNDTLKSQVEEVSAVNERLSEINSGNDKKISELHESLHDENSELVREIEEMKKMLTIEKETVRESEKFLEEVTAQMTTMIADQKKNFEEVIADLRTSHNEAKKALDKALKDVAHKSKLLDDKSAENVVLSEQIHTTENEIDVLKTENQALNDELRESQSDSDGLKVTIQELLSSNKENITQMTILEEELTAKNNVISGMTADTHHISALLNEKTVENVDLAEQLSQAKAKTAELEADVQALVVSNNEKLASFQVNYCDKLDDVTKELDAMVEQNKSLQVRVEEVSSVNCATEEKNTELAKELERLESLLTNELASHNTTKKMLDSAVRTSEEAVDNVKAQTAAQKVMETNIADLTRTVDRAKKSLDQALADARNKNILLQEKTGEISDLKYKISRLEALTEQHHISNDDKNDMIIAVKVESDELKSIVENLRSKNTEYATEIENLTSSMQEMVERNETLQARVEDIIAANVKLTHANNVNEKKSTQDETAKQQELEETKKMLEFEKENNVAIIEKSQETLEAVTAEMSAMMSDQAAAYEENIAALGKSLNEVKSSLGEALIDINRKNSLLQTKSAEVVNLTEQLEVHRVKIDELTIEVQSLVANKEEITQQKATLQSDMAALLENDFVAKNKMIDQLKTDVDAWKFTCKEKTAEIADLTEQLQLSKNESDGLNADVQSLVASNEGFAHQVSVLEDDLAAKELIIDETAMSLEEKSEEIVNLAGQLALSRMMIDDMSIDIQRKISLLEEKSAEIADLTERLQLNNVDCDELMTEVKSLNDINKENSNQISLLDVELAAKRNTIDQMTAEIELKSFALEEKITEITYLTEQLELSKEKVEAIVIINEANAQKITMLEDDLAKKTFVIDKISEDIQQKDMMLDGKTLDILNLTEQLQLSKTESDELKKDVKSLLTSNEDIAHQVSELKDDLVAKEFMINETAMSLEEKSEEIADLSKRLQISMAEKYGLKTEVEALVTSHKEIVQKMTMLGDELVEKSTMIDKMSDHIQRKSTSLEEKSSEMNDLKDQLKLSKAERDELMTEVEALIASKNDIIQQKSSLENDVVAPLESDLAAKNFIIDKMNTDIQRWETTCKEKTGEISDLNEKVQILKVDKEGLKKDIKSLVVINKENRQQLSTLEKDLVAKKILIDEMTLNVQQKNILLEERLEENTELSERLEKSNAETDGLKKEVDDLTSRNADNLNQISSLEQNLAANKIALDKMREEIQHKTALIEEKADEVIDFTEQVKLLKAESSTLKMEVEALLASKEKIFKQMSLMEGDLADKTIAIDEMSEDIQHKNVLLDGNTAEIANLTEHIETFKNENDGLKTKFEQMIIMNEEHVRRISVLEDDLSAKTTAIDTISNDIQQKTVSLEEKSAEIADLKEQLQLSKTELAAEVKSLVTINEANLLQIAMLEDDIAAKKIEIDVMSSDIQQTSISLDLKSGEINDLNEHLQLIKAEHASDIKSFVTTNDEMSKQIQALEDDLSAKQLEVDELNEDIKNKCISIGENSAMINDLTEKIQSCIDDLIVKQLEVDELSKEFQQKTISLNEKTAEIEDLTEQIRSNKMESDRLKTENDALVASNMENAIQISSLEDEVNVKKTAIEGLSSELQHKTMALDESLVEIIDISDQLQTSRENSDELKRTVKALITANEDHAMEIRSLEKDLTIKITAIDAMAGDLNSITIDLEAKNIVVEELSEDIQQKIISIEKKTAEIDTLSDRLQLLKVENDGLKAEAKLLLVSKKANSVRITTLEEDLAAKTNEIDKMRADIQRNNEDLTEKSAELVDLTERLHKALTKSESLMTDNKALIAGNSDRDQKISLLENDLVAKTIKLDQKRADIHNMTKALEESLEEVSDLKDQLLLSRDKSGGLKTELAAMIIISESNLQQATMLEDDLAAKTTIIDEMSSDIKQKTVSLEEKSAEIADLKEQLQLSKTELAAEVKSLVTINEANLLQIAMLEDDIAAKKIEIDVMSSDIQQTSISLDLKSGEINDLNEHLQLIKAEHASDIKSFVTTNDEMSKQIQALEDDLSAKQLEVDELSKEFQQKTISLNEKTAEIEDLTEQIRSNKMESDRLKTENDALVASNMENAIQISSLEDEVNVKKTAIEGLSSELQHKTMALEESLVEIIDISDQLQTSRENSDELKRTMKAVVTVNEENAQQIAMLENDALAKKNVIDEMTSDIEQKDLLLEEKVSENDSLMMQLHFSSSKIDGLEAENKSLVIITKDNEQQITMLENDLAAKTIAIDVMSSDIKKKTISLEENAAEIDILKEKYDMLLLVNSENIERVSALKDELTVTKAAINEMSFAINQANASLEGKTAELTDLTEQLQLAMAKNEELNAEVRALAASDKEKEQLIVELEEDVASQESVIDEMSAEIDKWNASCNEMTDENAALNEHIQVLNAKCNKLKSKLEHLEITNERLETKSYTDSTDLKNLSTFLQEMVELNGALTTQVEEIGAANEKLAKTNKANEEKTAESMDAVGRMTKSLQEMVELNGTLTTQVAEISAAKKNLSKVYSAKEKKNAELLTNISKSVDELTISLNEKSAEIDSLKERRAELLVDVDNLSKTIENERASREEEVEELKKMLKMEMEDKADIFRKEEVKAQMKAQMDIQNEIMSSEEKESLVVSHTRSKELNEENETLHAQVEQAYATIEVLDYSMKKRLEMEKEEKDAIVRKSEETLKDVTEQLAKVSARKESLEEEVRNLSNSLVEMSFDINEKKNLLEHQTADIVNLTERLQQVDGLEAEVQLLMNSNREKVQQIVELEDELTSHESLINELSSEIDKMGNILDKEKQFSGKVVKKLEDTLEEVMIQMTDKELSISNLVKSLDEALVASNNKSMVLEEKSAEVDDLTEQLKLFRIKNEEQRQYIQTMIASNKDQIHRLTLASNKEIADLNKSLKLAMDRNKELEAKVHIATNSIKDSIQQMVVLEDDNKSKKKIIDEMSVDMISLIDRLDKQDDINFQNIGQIAELDDELRIKNATVEEKNSIIDDMNLDIINLTKQLELAMTKNQELETDNQSLVDSKNDFGHVDERLKLYMSKSEAQRREIQSLVADREEQIHQITIASQKEITDLNERLVHVMNRNKELEKVVQTLTNSVKGSTQQMIETEDDNESKEETANVMSTIRDWSAARGALAAEHDALKKRLDVLRKPARTSSFEDFNDTASFIDSRGSFTSEQTSRSQDRSDDDQATSNDTASFDDSHESFSSDIFESEQTSRSQDGSDDDTFVSDNRQDKTIRQNGRICTDAQSRLAP